MTTKALILSVLLFGCGAHPLPADLRLPPTAPAAEPALHAGIAALWRGDLEAASRSFNRALEVAPRDPHLHFLNAYTYDLQAESGAIKRAELAEVGYRLALDIDPHHWAAAYRLGRLLWHQGRAVEAQQTFVKAMRAAPNRPEPAFALAVSAYAGGDPQTAAWALARLPEARQSAPAVLRSKALVQAALGDDRGAVEHLRAYQTLTGRAAHRTARRVEAWKGAHARGLAQPMEPGAPPLRAQAPPSMASAPKVAEKMVVFDAVIITQEESATSQRGLNLLATLKVQFGGTVLDASRSTTRDVRTGAVTAFSENSGSALNISVPSVTYALNIANASDSRNEIVARPSVIAHDGQRSEVFIGSEVTYIAAGQLGGSSHAKEVGITLDVTPTFLQDGRLRVAVKTEFGAFLPTAAPGSFQQAVATVKNRSNVTAEIAFGETLALAAGTATRRSTSRSGVPILRDIPILQYLFSSRSEATQKTAVIILLTPRRPLRRPADGPIAHGVQGPPSALAALQRRVGDFLTPTDNTLATLDRLRGSALQSEFRRGDLTFAGLEPPAPDDDAPSAAAARGRRFLRDALETLYF